MLLLGLAATPASAAGPHAWAFRLHLTGDQEATPTCAPPDLCGDPDASANMVLVVNVPRDTVCFVTRWFDIDGTVVAAHIHHGPAGAPAGVVVPLFAGTFDGTDMTGDCVPANGWSDDILANPAAFYVNIHSTTYQPGAVRDQLG
jgi:hypothetical protein